MANPYPSAISVKEFIEDNDSSISGTLYFWEHKSETTTTETGSEGHNYAGYIGGYATRTIAMGVTARAAAANSGSIDLILEAESATITGGIIESVSDLYDAVQLDGIGENLVFENITSIFGVLTIRYKANNSKSIRIKEDGIIKGDFILPATAGVFSIYVIPQTVVNGSDITLESLDTNVIQIDYLNNLSALDAIITNGTTEAVDETIDAVMLDANSENITFKRTTSGVDYLRIIYSAVSDKIIQIKVTGLAEIQVTLPSTGSVNTFDIFEIKLCAEAGSDITLTSIDDDVIRIDYLNLYDEDGIVSCAPNLGGNDLTYTEPKPYIAIGQGFFVEADATGTVVFNNSQREYKLEGADAVFLKSSGKSDPNSIFNLPVIKLGMDFNSSNDGNNYHRQIGVSFSQYTSFTHDKGYDAEIYDVGNTDLYWKFPSNDKKYVIAGVQAISNDLEVPIEITMGYSGNVTIKVDEMKNVTDNVFITDKLTNESYDIINGKATLTLNQGVYSDRFVLAFTESTALSVDDTIENAYTNLYVDNTNHNLMISKNLEVEISKVELYNILGKKVGLWNIEEQKSTYQLKIKEQLPTGVYIVKMNTNKGETNKKIVIE